MHTLDIVIVIGYLIICLLIGLVKSTKIKNIKEFTLGKKRFPVAILVATTFATSVGIVATMGSVEKTYELGLTYIVALLMNPLSWFLSGRILAYSIDEFRDCLTLSDIMHTLYGPLGRWITNIAALIATIGVLALCMSAISTVVGYFTNIPHVYGVLIGAFVIIVYSALGGIQGVTLTDVFQFIIFFIAFPLACSLGFHDVGGITGIISKLPTSHITIQPSDYILTSSFILVFLIPNTAIPMIQRALMSRDSKELRKTFDIVGFLTFPFSIIITLIGLITYIKAPNIEPSTALFYFVNNYLPAGLVGFMVASILAVIMSTVDSFLNSTSVLFAKDIIKQIFPEISDEHELTVARLSTVFLVTISIFLAYKKKSILDIIWFISNFWEPFVTIPLLIGMLKVRAGEKGYTIAIILSGAALLMAKIYNGGLDTISLGTVSLISAVTLIAWTLINKKEARTTYNNTI